MCDNEALLEDLCDGQNVTVMFRDGVWVVWTGRGAFVGARLHAALTRAFTTKYAPLVIEGKVVAPGRPQGPRPDLLSSKAHG